MQQTCDNSKRNYIRRKKYMNDSYQKIAKTLEFVNTAAKLNFSESEIHKRALSHAQAIEASIWCPHLRLTASEYEGISGAKTTELCRAITKQYLPSLNGNMNFEHQGEQMNEQERESIPKPINILTIKIPVNPKSRTIESPQPKQKPPPLITPPASLKSPPKYPIPMAMNRPLTPYCFPIPIVPKSAPQSEPFFDDFGIPEFEKKYQKNSFIPSFEQDVDPFHDPLVDPMDSLPAFDTGLDDVFDIGACRVESSIDPSDRLFKF